jgi:hypothetical protein
MTKKHFIAFAARIAGIEDVDLRREVALLVAAICTDFNDRFDLSCFLRACGVEE